MPLSARRIELIDVIVSAFCGTQYPGDDNITPSGGRDRERDDVAAMLRGKHWDELTARLLQPNMAGMYLLSRVGFAYYLPGYMLVVLREAGSADVLPDVLLLALTPRPGGADKRLEAVVAILTAEQRTAVVAFLAYVVSTGDERFGDPDAAQQALNAWSQAEAGSRSEDTTS